jgi:hypothetical protein
MHALSNHSEKIHVNQDCGLSKVIKLNHLRKFEVLLTKTPPEPVRFVKKALVTAIKMETLDMVQLLCQEYERDQSLISLYPILVAVEVGNAAIFSYLVSLVDFDLTEHNNECFVLALKRGQHNILRWITTNHFFLDHLADRKKQRAVALDLREKQKLEENQNRMMAQQKERDDGVSEAKEKEPDWITQPGDIFPTFEKEEEAQNRFVKEPTQADVNLFNEVGELEESKDGGVISEKLDTFSPTKFNFLNPYFIESLEIALPFIDEEVIYREHKMILLRAFQKNGYQFITYLLAKWPCFKEEYFSNLALYNEKLSNPLEKKAFLVDFMWPVMRLIYLLAGEEESALLKEICLSIMCALLFYLSQ